MKKLGLSGTLLILCLSPIYLFWLLYAKVVNFIGVNGLRSINGKLQTPVVFYKHPITRRIVVFVATTHLAEPEYYKAIQELIDSLCCPRHLVNENGYKILFEGTGKLSPEEEQALTEKEQGIARQLEFLFSWVRKLGEVMFLQHQKEGLAYAASWVNTDIRLYNLVQLFAGQNVTLLKRDFNIDEIFNDEAEKAATRWLVNKLFSQFVPVITALSFFGFFSRSARTMGRLILGTRNEIAFRGISEHLKDSNVVTIWGAGHLRGIEKLLNNAGFEEVSRKWFTAYTARDIHI